MPSLLIFLSEPDCFLVGPFVLGFWIPFETGSGPLSFLGRHLPSFQRRKSQVGCLWKQRTKKDGNDRVSQTVRKIRLCLKRHKKYQRKGKEKGAGKTCSLFILGFAGWVSERGDPIWKCLFPTSHPSSWALTGLPVSAALNSITPAFSHQSTSAHYESLYSPFNSTTTVAQ